MTDTAAKYDAYTNTVLELPGVPDGRIDLRRPIGDAERAALASVGLTAPFAVMTAENPLGRNEEDAPTEAAERRQARANDEALAALVAALGDAELPFVRVDGVAPDGSYRERCVAIRAARDEAVALAARFGQLALFWYDGNRFWLLPAIAGESPRPLPDGAGD